MSSRSLSAASSLYLLYDASCMACSNVAEAVRTTGVAGLSVRSLQDPTMQELLTEGGRHGLFEPALLDVDDDSVRIYTGLRLRTRLVRRVGPRKALYILRALVESAAQGSSRGMPRRRFLTHTGLAGAGAIVAPQIFSRVANAATQRAHGIQGWARDISGSRELTGEQMRKHMREDSVRVDLDRSLRAIRTVVPENVAAANAVPHTMSIEALQTADKAVGVEHKSNEGGRLIALSFAFGNITVASYRRLAGDGSEEGVQTLTYQNNAERQRALLLTESEAGEIYTVIPPTTTLESCVNDNDCGGGDDPCYICRGGDCVSIDTTCAATCCGPCGPSCLGGPYSCISCVLAWCPICIGLRNCCTQGAGQCRWRQACA